MTSALLGLFAKKTASRNALKEAFDFNFELPPYRQQQSKLPDPVKLWVHLDAIAAKPVHLLVELNHFLHALNRTYIGGDKRYTMTTRCLGYASPAIRQVFFEHQKGKALPENQAKREALMAAVTCVKEFSQSFKRIIKNEYKFSDKKFKPPSRRVRQCMVAVLDMFHAEQRLKALRYHRPSKLFWRDCNNIYFILHATGDTRKPFKPMGLSVGRVSAGENASKPLKTSAQELYVLIQLFGLIDPNSLSLQQTVVVENYLKQFLSQLHFDAFTEDRFAMNCIVTGYGHEGAPLLSEKIDASAYALVMDVKPLMISLKQDYSELLMQFGGAKNDSRPPYDGEIPNNIMAINRLEDIERLLALHAMLHKLRETERADTRKYTDESQDIYVYNGFTAGFHMLNANKTDQNKRNQLNIDLARRSASLASGAQPDKLTQWGVVNESAGGLLIRTKETQYIKNLFIGQLVIFAKSKPALAYPSCGWVVRICRDVGNNVEISLKILASHIESVVVQTEILKKNTMGMPGIMIFDAGEDLQLLMHQSHRLFAGGGVTIQRGGNSYDYVIGGIEFFQREFVIYHLQQ